MIIANFKYKNSCNSCKESSSSTHRQLVLLREFLDTNWQLPDKWWAAKDTWPSFPCRNSDFRHKAGAVTMLVTPHITTRVKWAECGTLSWLAVSGWTVTNADDYCKCIFLLVRIDQKKLRHTMLVSTWNDLTVKSEIPIKHNTLSSFGVLSHRIAFH